MEKRKCTFKKCEKYFLVKNLKKRFYSLNNIKKSSEPLPLIGKVFKKEMLSILFYQSLIFASKEIMLWFKICRPTLIEMKLKKEMRGI